MPLTEDEAKLLRQIKGALQDYIQRLQENETGDYKWVHVRTWDDVSPKGNLTTLVYRRGAPGGQHLHLWFDLRTMKWRCSGRMLHFFDAEAAPKCGSTLKSLVRYLYRRQLQREEGGDTSAEEGSEEEDSEAGCQA